MLGHIVGEVDNRNNDGITTSNPCEALHKEEANKDTKEKGEQSKESTKDQVNKSFGESEKIAQQPKLTDQDLEVEGKEKIKEGKTILENEKENVDKQQKQVEYQNKQLENAQLQATK